MRRVKARAITGLLAALALVPACERAPEPAPPMASATPSPPPGAPAERARRSIGEVTWGEPDAAKVRRLMLQRAADVRRCYESALAQDERARGKLTLRFTIAPSGAIERVAAVRSTFARKDVAACIVDVVRRWTTPFRPAEPVEVEYPVSFSPR